MESVQKMSIQRNFQLLLDSVDVGAVIDYLYQEGVITADEAQDFHAERRTARLPKEVTRRLLFVLQERKDGYWHLCKALDSLGTHEHVVRALTDTERELTSLGELSERRVANSRVNGLRHSATRDEPDPRMRYEGDSVQSRPIHLDTRPTYLSPQERHHTYCREVNNTGDEANLDSINSLASVDISLRPYGNDSVGQIRPIPDTRASPTFLSPQVRHHSNCRSGHGNNDTGGDEAQLDTPDSANSLASLLDISLRPDPSDDFVMDQDRPDIRRHLNGQMSVECTDRNIRRRHMDIATNCSVIHSRQGDHSVSTLSVATQYHGEDIVPSTTKLGHHDTITPLQQYRDILSSVGPTRGMASSVISFTCPYCYDADSEGTRGDSCGSDDDDDDDYGGGALSRPRQALAQIKGLPRANSLECRRTTLVLNRVFNELSTMINSGRIPEFLIRKQELQHFSVNGDLRFTLMYLTASCHLWQEDHDNCEQAIDEALSLVPNTTRPSRCAVEIHSSLAWMLFKQGKFRRLQDVVDDALQLIEQDPMECTGRAAGWIYVDQARIHIAMAGTGTDASRLLRLRTEAASCLETAMEHFNNDQSEDGPFGYKFAALMLASCLLACGDRLHALHIKPDEDDVSRAQALLEDAKRSGIEPGGILAVHYHLAKCDLYLRQGPVVYRGKALQQAVKAQALAAQLEIPDLLTFAEERCAYFARHPVPDTDSASSRLLEAPCPCTRPRDTEPPKDARRKSFRKHRTRGSFSDRHSSSLLFARRSLLSVLFLLVLALLLIDCKPTT